MDSDSGDMSGRECKWRNPEPQKKPCSEQLNYAVFSAYIICPERENSKLENLGIIGWENKEPVEQRQQRKRYRVRYSSIKLSSTGRVGCGAGGCECPGPG